MSAAMRICLRDDGRLLADKSHVAETHQHGCQSGQRRARLARAYRVEKRAANTMHVTVLRQDIEAPLGVRR
jgi:hypothetical protein